MILIVTGCNESTADIVFALDASGSIESENFGRVVQFVGAVVHSLTIRTRETPDGFQVALVSFANRVDIRFYLNTYTDKELLLAAINIPYTRGRTNLDDALRYTQNLRLCNQHLKPIHDDKHRSRIRYLDKKIANFNEFSEIKKIRKIRTKIR